MHPEQPELNQTVSELGRLPLAEEIAWVEKRSVVTGKVTVKTVVDTLQQVLKETLAGEKVDVERVAINRVVTAPPTMRVEGDVTIIPIFEERIVVEKQLVLVEEIRVRRTQTSEHVEVPVELRKQRAVITES